MAGNAWVDKERQLWILKVNMAKDEPIGLTEANERFNAIYNLPADYSASTIAGTYSYPTSYTDQNKRVEAGIAQIAQDSSLGESCDFYTKISEGVYKGKLRDMKDSYGRDLNSMNLDIRSSLRIPISLLWQEMAACDNAGNFIHPEYFVRLDQVNQYFVYNHINVDGNGMYIRKDLAYYLSILANMWGNDPYHSSFGKTLDIRAAYRSPARNLNANGSLNSYHLTGTAVDIHMSLHDEGGYYSKTHKKHRDRFAAMAHNLGFGGIIMYTEFLHIDIGPYNRQAFEKGEIFVSPSSTSGKISPLSEFNKISQSESKETIHEND